MADFKILTQIIGVPVGLPCAHSQNDAPLMPDLSAFRLITLGVTTTTMAVGAAYLARRKCIVQKLTAIESLAGVDVLCT